MCRAYATGLQHVIPRAKTKQQFTDLHEVAVVIRKNGRILMRQCAAGERWAGLWDFPRFAVESEGPLFAEKEIVTKVREQTGITCRLGPLLKTIKHGVTRYRITLDCYRATFISGRPQTNSAAEVRWVAPSELADLPLSTTGRKIARLETVDELAKKSIHRRPNIRLPRQRFTHQNRIHTGRLQPLDVGMRLDAALRHQHAILRHLAPHPNRMLQDRPRTYANCDC